MLRPYYCTPSYLDIPPREPPPGDPYQFLDQLVVAEPRGAGRLGKAGIHGRVGDDARQRVELEDVGDAEPVDPDVDPTPVAAAERVVGIERRALDLTIHSARHARRALEDRQGRFGPVPHPLGFVAVHGGRARWQRREVEPDHGQAVRLGAVSENRDRELWTREVRLDQHGLRVALGQEPDALRERPRAVA